MVTIIIMNYHGISNIEINNGFTPTKIIRIINYHGISNTEMINGFAPTKLNRSSLISLWVAKNASKSQLSFNKKRCQEKY